MIDVKSYNDWLHSDGAGVFSGVSNEEYHTGRGVSKSDLDLVHRSPLHYRAVFSDPVPASREETAAMIFGTAFHTAVLEPDRFTAEYAAAPECDKRTKAGKAALAEWQAANAGKTALTPEDMAAVCGMRDTVMASPIGARLVESSRHELSVYAEMSGTLCKCRPDGWIMDEGILFDLKSTKDASANSFTKAIANYRYHVQAAWYRAVVDQLTDNSTTDFFFVAVEKEPPYAVALYQLDDISLEAGAETMRADLDAYRRAVETGKWSGYPRQIQTLTLPAWAF